MDAVRSAGLITATHLLGQSTLSEVTRDSFAPRGRVRDAAPHQHRVRNVYNL